MNPLFIPLAYFLLYVAICGWRIARGLPFGLLRHAPVLLTSRERRPVTLPMQTIYTDGENVAGWKHTVGAMDFYHDGLVVYGCQYTYADGAAIDVTINDLRFQRPAGFGQTLIVTDADGQQLHYRYYFNCWTQLVECQQRGPAYLDRQRFAYRGCWRATGFILCEVAVWIVLLILLLPCLFFLIHLSLCLAKYGVWLVRLVL